MRRIAPVVPLRKARVVGLEAGHQGQPAAGLEQAVQSAELSRRRVEVLGHLGAGDEVVAGGQYRRIRLKERVVQRHGVAGLAQHGSQHRAGAATIVQPVLPGWQALQQRLGHLLQKAPVAGLCGVVVVQAVLGLFALGGGQL